MFASGVYTSKMPRASRSVRTIIYTLQMHYTRASLPPVLSTIAWLEMSLSCNESSRLSLAKSLFLSETRFRQSVSSNSEQFHAIKCLTWNLIFDSPKRSRTNCCHKSNLLILDLSFQKSEKWFEFTAVEKRDPKLQLSD